MVIQEAGNPQGNIYEEAAAMLRNTKIPDTVVPLVRNKSVRNSLRAIDPKGKGVDLQIRDYPQRDDIGNLVIFSRDNSRVYVSDGNKSKDSELDPVVYSTEEERHPSNFTNVAGFLDTKSNNRIEYDPEKAADIALFGTINSNLSGGGTGWMEHFGERVHELTHNNPDWPAEISVFNPNLGSGTQEKTEREGLDMAQFARESHNLFHADIVVMNFEPKRGGIALAELRMAMLASLLTGHKLIVRMEQPDMSDINVVRSRVVAQADIDFFRAKFQDRLNMDYYPPGALPLEQLPEVALEAYKKQQGKVTHREKYHLPPRPKGEKKIVLSGSSSNARDMALRLEITEQLKQRGDEVIDTYFDNYDGPANQGMERRVEIIRKNRMAELDEMLGATDNLVYAGKGSLSQFGQVTTALLFSALNGSRTHVLLGKDPRDDYDGGTYRSHSARVFMDYSLAKFLHVSNALQGLSPELEKKIPAISDRIAPVVRSIHGSVFENMVARIKHLRYRKEQSDLPKISNIERLVPKGYTPDIAAAVVRAVGESYPGYPDQQHRIRMTENEYKTWVKAGKPAKTLFDTHSEAYIGNHPNRQSKKAQIAREAGRVQDYDGSQTFSNGTFGSDTETDSNGAPLHPYTREMLLAGVAATGPGFYWRLGENPAADPMVIRLENGKLQVLVITRKDSQTLARHDALPGGMGDPEDAGLSQTLERELHEEAGVSPELIRQFPRIEEVYKGVTADPRATVHAYPTTRLDVLIPTQEQLAQMTQLKAGDDAVGVHWMTTTPENIQRLFGMHPELVMMGIQAWQQQTGRIVKNDGTIGIAA